MSFTFFSQFLSNRLVWVESEVILYTEMHVRAIRCSFKFDVWNWLIGVSATIESEPNEGESFATWTLNWAVLKGEPVVREVLWGSMSSWDRIELFNCTTLELFFCFESFLNSLPFLYQFNLLCECLFQVPWMKSMIEIIILRLNLSERDFLSCLWFLGNFSGGLLWLRLLWFLDETHVFHWFDLFHLSIYLKLVQMRDTLFRDRAVFPLSYQTESFIFDCSLSLGHLWHLFCLLPVLLVEYFYNHEAID